MDGGARGPSTVFFFMADATRRFHSGRACPPKALRACVERYQKKACILSML